MKDATENQFLTIPTEPMVTLLPLGIGQDGYELLMATIELWKDRLIGTERNLSPSEPAGRAGSVEAEAKEIRDQHKVDELANRGRLGMPQGPCQCEVCKSGRRMGC